MYYMSIQCQQVLNTAYVVCSLSEIDDEGTTRIISSASTQEGQYAALDEDELWVFTEHIAIAVRKCLSTAQNEVFLRYYENGSLDGGGWAGPGSGAGERSESP